MSDLSTIDPTISAQADAVAGRLAAGETAWARTPLARRAALLGEFRDLVDEHAEEWVRVATGIKQLPAGSAAVGEEWMSGPWAVVHYANALAGTLASMAEDQAPTDGFSLRSAPGGRTAVQVLPHSVHDRLLLNGYRAEVWMQPGVTADDVRNGAGLGQRAPHETRGAALVLGAGNITSIAPLDVLYMLYAENRVAVLKLNPITDALEDVLRSVFAPYIELGAVEILTGEVAIGTALAHHPGIAAVHMTGSEQTHDAIVWGPGEQGRANKAAGTPQLAKPMTAELGGVAPVIVVPGRWSRADLRHQARHVATMRLHNSGFNCIAGQIVLISSDWAQKDAFLTELRTALREAPARPAWYPGCELRVADARSRHDSAEAVGGTPERTLLAGLDLADLDETAFSTEYFGPVLGVAELPGEGERFLADAVTAANERLRGTLGANVLVHPRTRRRMGGAFLEQIARLRYGTVGVNVWTGVGYLTPHATWGAFPGHALDDIQSGSGVVHNALLLDGTERTVVQGPFRPFPRSLASISPLPPWFVQNRTAATTGERLARFSARPRWRSLPAIFASALRG